MNRIEMSEKAFEVKSSVHDLISRIQVSQSVEEACLLLEQYLLGLDICLLSIKFCDIEDEHRPIRPFVAYPSAISELSEKLSQTGGCPISKEALRRLTPFDALNIDSSRYPDFLSKRFLEEIGKLDHRHIAVIPVLFGRGLFVCNVGINQTSFAGENREELISTICHALVNILKKFKVLAAAFKPKCLSLSEAQTILLISNGSNLSEVAMSMGLSEFAIKAYLDHAQKKMSAKTLYHLIAKAITQGEVPNLLAKKS